MGIELQEELGGRLLIVHVTGKLDTADYERFVPEIDRLVQEKGKLRILFEMSDFHGWTAGAMWEDMKFGIKHFRDIEKLAIVGETRWQKGMSQFCKPFTAAEIKFFTHEQGGEARAWLEQ